MSNVSDPTVREERVPNELSDMVEESKADHQIR